MGLFDEERKSYVRFEYVTYNDEGDETSRITRTLYDGESECLTNILQEFTYFLQGMTYSYVAGVASLNEDGDISHSSEL